MHMHTRILTAAAVLVTASTLCSQVSAEAAWVRVPDYDDKDHPGYRGIAIALLVDRTLYVVNGILTDEDPKAKAKQQKLLGSIQVHK